MKLQIKKDRVPLLQQRLEHRRPGRDEQLQAHLEPGARAFQAVDQPGGGSGIRYVEGNNQSLAGRLQRIDMGQASGCG